MDDAVPRQVRWFVRPELLAALAIVAAGAACAFAYGAALIPALVATAVALWAACRLAGPLLAFDLSRLGRSRDGIALRCAYALVLLTALVVVYEVHFPGRLWTDPFGTGLTMPPAMLRRLARSFVSTFLIIQGAAVLVLTPGYIADVIAHERWKRTLEMLFTTPLTDREIVLGKLFARLGHLLVMLLSGLPVLSVLVLWGGVEITVLAAGFVATALTLLSAGSMSVFCSSVCQRPFTALVASYVCVLATVGGSFACALPAIGTPITLVDQLEEKLSVEAERSRNSTGRPPRRQPLEVALPLLGTYGFVHVSVATLCCVAAILSLRATGNDADYFRGNPPRTPTRVPVQRRAPAGQEVARSNAASRSEGWAPWQIPFETCPPKESPQPWEQVLQTLSWSERPRQNVIGPALLWKEASFCAPFPLRRLGARRFVWTCVGLCAAIVVGVELPGVILYAAYPKGYRTLMAEGLGPLVRGGAIALTVVWCALVAFRTAGSISREREQRTLMALLMLPIRRREILEAKWLGSILRYRQLGYAVLIVWLVGLALGALHPLGVMVLLVSSVAYLLFFTTLGLSLSYFARTTAPANLLVSALLLFFFGGTWAVSGILGLTTAKGADPWLIHFAHTGLNPTASWWHAGFSAWQAQTVFNPASGGRAQLLATLVGAGILVVVSGLLWLVTAWRFRARVGR